MASFSQSDAPKSTFGGKPGSKSASKGGKPGSKQAPKSASGAASGISSGLSAEALAAFASMGVSPVVDLSHLPMDGPSVRPVRQVQAWMEHVDAGAAPAPECKRSFQEAEVGFITGAEYIKHFPLVQAALGRGVRFYFLGKAPEDTTFDGLIEKAGAPMEAVDGVTVYYFCKHALSHCKSALPGGGFKKHVASGCAHIEFTGTAEAKRLNTAFKACVCLDEKCSGQDHRVPCDHFPYAYHPVNGTDHLGVKVSRGQLVCSTPCCPGCDLAHAPPKEVAAFAAKLAKLKLAANPAEVEALTACAAAIKAVGPSGLKELTKLLSDLAMKAVTLAEALKPADLGDVVEALNNPANTEVKMTLAAATVVAAVNDLPPADQEAAIEQIRITYASIASKAAGLPAPKRALELAPGPLPSKGDHVHKHARKPNGEPKDPRQTGPRR